MEIIDEGLTFEGKLALSIKTIEALPSNNQLAFVNNSNESILKANLLPQEFPELDEQDHISLELRRQDIKINLLLDMVSELLMSSVTFPAEIDLKMTAASLESCFISNYYAMKISENVEISLFFTPSTPKAIVLYGIVVASDNQTNSVIRFLGVNQAVQDLLEKIIFRHHRRNIAQHRHQS